MINKPKKERKKTIRKPKTDELKSFEKKVREDFGGKLRVLREGKKLQQSTLADRLGFHIQTVSRYERALIDPTLSNLITIAKYFNVSVDYLADFSTIAYTDKEYLQIPYIEEPEKYWTVDKEFLKNLTAETNLCAFTVRNNNFHPDFQRGDIVLVCKGKKPAVDKYVLILSGSEYIIKRVVSISPDGNSVNLSSGTNDPLEVSINDIEGIIEAFLRGYL